MNTPNDSQTVNVLIVDDTADDRDLLARILEKEGYGIHTASHGSAALHRATLVSLDLIVLDINMPEMNGYEVCQAFKADPCTAEIPILFISASDDTRDKVKAFTSGGVDYITKPFSKAEVQARIRYQLKIRRAEQEIRQWNEQLEIRVEQRTAQLEARKAELKAANQRLEQQTTELEATNLQLEATNVQLARESKEREQAQAQVLAQRSQTIERTYEAVHNGPLQDLAVILRNLEGTSEHQDKLRSQLKKVNQDLRGIYQAMREAARDCNDSLLHLEGGMALDLDLPLTDLFYQIIDHTLERDFPGFETLLTHTIPDFRPLEDCHLPPDHKRGLVLFLQEALCNVGKHGMGATRIEMQCQATANHYCLEIIDDGVGLSDQPDPASSCQGTVQAQRLATQLGGTFERCPHSPRGMICRLTWPITTCLPQDEG